MSDGFNLEMNKEEIISLLSNVKNEDNYSLYDHLQKLFDTKLEMQNDEKFLDLFEDISYRIRSQGYYKEDEKKNMKKYLEHFVKANQGKKTLLDPLVKRDGDDVTPITSIPGYVPDFYNLFQQLEWCGISISDKESYLLTNSLRTLAYEKNLSVVTFWGKIFGKEKDYYIIETNPLDANTDDKKEPEIDQEPRGSGLNSKSYLVANDLTGPWKELDDVKPSLLKLARKIKVLFTGDLNKPVVSNPWFNGKEADLLRCQIARISSHINIIPNVNNYKANQQEIEKNEESPQPNINDSLNIKNWVHFSANILKEGRLIHFEREPPQNVDPEVFKKEVLANDPFEPRLKSIIEDKPLKAMNLSIPSWKLAYCYDDKIYTNPNIIMTNNDEEGAVKKDNSIHSVIVHLRSLTWPGSHVIRIKNENYYLYFGWGSKYEENDYLFTDFPNIQSECIDLPVGEEPNAPPEEVISNMDQDN